MVVGVSAKRLNVVRRFHSLPNHVRWLTAQSLYYRVFKLGFLEGAMRF